MLLLLGGVNSRDLERVPIAGIWLARLVKKFGLK